MSFFRHCSIDRDPDELLDPDNHVSTPWGEADHGRCDKCGGSGEVDHRCLSCLELGPREDCPSCTGRAEYRDVCPTCEGSGEITRTFRRGVSVFPTAAGLRRYLAERDFDPASSVMVELNGSISRQRDLDADSGALLIHPTEIVAVYALDGPRRLDEPA